MKNPPPTRPVPTCDGSARCWQPGALSATGAFAGFTYIVKLLGDESGFSPGTVSVLLVVFGVACLAGVSITGALLDRFPRFALPTAVATQAAGTLGLFSIGTHPVAAVACLP